MPEMTLAKKLYEDQKEAARAKDRFRLAAIRLLRAELQNAAIAKKDTLDQQEELAVLAREVKRRHEALGDFERSGRRDLVDDLKREIKILEKYLPEQLSEDEIEAIVREVIAETEAVSRQDMGKVMSRVMPRVKGKADGSLVRQLVERILA